MMYERFNIKIVFCNNRILAEFTVDGNNFGGAIANTTRMRNILRLVLYFSSIDTMIAYRLCQR